MAPDTIARPVPPTAPLTGRPARPVDRRPIRILVAGAGYIAEYHLAILKELEGVDVVGICDPMQDRLADVAKRWSVPQQAARFSDLLKSAAADAVHILTPPQTHVDVITEALDAGLHVLAEKPMALSLADSDRLMAQAAERGLRLDANHNARWHPQFLRLKADISAARLGAIQHVVALQNVPLAQLAAGAHGHWMFREPRNIVFEQFPHPLSQICDLLGPVVDVSTICNRPRTLRTGGTFYDNWLISLETADATAQLYMAFDGKFPYWQLHVIGQDAAARIDLLANTYVLDRATASVPPVDAVRRGMGRGWSESIDASAQFARYTGATLKFTPRRDPYYVSMKGAIDAFYQRLTKGDEGTSLSVDRDVAAAMDVIAASMPVIDAPAAIVKAPAIVTSAQTADVLVIGSTGFIGQYVVRELAEHGLKVRAMARTPSALPDSVRAAASAVAEGDVRDRDAVNAAVRGCRRVVHLVASAPEGWAAYERLYLDGTRFVAEACVEQGVEQLQFASSIAALYLGQPGAVVTNATPPDDKIDQRGEYARAKILCERMLLDFHRTKKLPVVIVRPGIVVGAGGPPEHLGVGHWPSPTRCVPWGAADYQLPFVLGSDVAKAMVSALMRPGLEGRAFNVSGDVTLRASEYVAALAKFSRRDIQLRPRSLAFWWALEHFGRTVKVIGGKKDSTALSWRELKYRSGASTLDCSDTKQTLAWTPEADRDRFLDLGVRAAVRP